MVRVNSRRGWYGCLSGLRCMAMALGGLLVVVVGLCLLAPASASASSPCTPTQCGIVVHLSDQRFDTYTAPLNVTQATDSTADVQLSIQRQWDFQLNGGNGQVGSASIVATSAIPANLWNGLVPPFTATATPLQAGQGLSVSSGVTTATAAPGFASSRTVSPLLIPPGGGTQVLTASFTVDSTGLSFVLLSLTPNQSTDSWSFTSSSDPADTGGVNASPGGGLSVSLNNPTPGITYTFTFTGTVANSSAQPVPSKPFLGLEAVRPGTPLTSVIASGYSSPDPALEGTVSYSFDGLYWLWPSAGSQFSVWYPNGPDPTSSGLGCSPYMVLAGQSTTCTVTVTDTSGSYFASPPTGAVTWSTQGSGTFSDGESCTLVGSGLVGPAFDYATCLVSYTPTATPPNPVRTDTVTATYAGDIAHTGSVSFYPGMGPGPFVTVISPPVLATGTYGQSYWAGEPAVSGPYGPYSWSLGGGTLPPGLTLSPDGTISGTPTSAGTFTFTATVSDSETPAQTVTVPEQIVIVQAASTINYTGPQQVSTKSNFMPSATLTSSTSGCQAGVGVTFMLNENPITGATGPYQLESATTAAGGSATGAAVSTNNWQIGSYTITATYAGSAGCAGSASGSALLVTAPGLATVGWGQYSVPGAGNMSFAFFAALVPGTHSYVGQFSLVNDHRWQFIATVTSYVKTSATTGQLSGKGSLYFWSPALNHCCGGWVLAASNVTYTVSFAATTKSSLGSLGIQIAYTPAAAQPGPLPNSSPLALARGLITMA
jgi:hypothetical protein